MIGTKAICDQGGGPIKPNPESSRRTTVGGAGGSSLSADAKLAGCNLRAGPHSPSPQRPAKQKASTEKISAETRKHRGS